MAKLSGTADPTIVKMAYAEALGNVPLDQSENYQKIAEVHTGFMKDIKTQAKNYKAMQAIDELAFETAMSVFDNPLAAQVIDSDYNMMYTEVEAQRKAWEDSKGFKDDDKGLADWNRKNQQIIQRYQGNQQDLIDLKTGVDGKLYDIKSMSKSDLNFMTNIANYQANKNNKSGIYNEKATEYMKNNPGATMEDMWNSLGVKEEGAVVKYHDPATGEYTYVSKVTDKYGEETIVSSKSSDLKSKFDKHRKADDSLLEAEKLYEKVHKNALQTDKSWGTFKNQYMNHLEKIIDDGTETNENTLGYLMNKKIGGQEKTFADALRDGDVSSAEIINSLSLDNDGYKGDVNKDGKLDEGDFTSVENYQKVVDAILNGELDKTSPGTTKEMYLDYMDTQFEKEHNSRKKVKTPEGPTDTGLFKKDETIALGEQKSWGKQVRYSAKEANGWLEDIKSGNEFYFDGSFYNYDPDSGKWTGTISSGDDAGAKTEYDDTNNMVKNVFKTNDPRFDNIQVDYNPKIDAETGQIIEEDGGTDEDFSSLSSDHTLTLSNMFDQKLPESKAIIAINDILKIYGVSERAVVPFAPGSKYKIKVGTEIFYTNDPSDKQLLLDHVNKLISQARLADKDKDKKEETKKETKLLDE